MKRQEIRKLLLTISLLLFPVTLYYFSPALIVDAGLKGIINGSALVFVSLFLLSIPFGRLFCGYFCPAGGLQECAFAVNGKLPKQGWRNNLKYAIWAVWLLAVAVCYIHGGKITEVDFFFETERGISVSSIPSYIIYYGIVCLVFVPSVLFGKRVFCHYFCWMAPFMAVGTKLRRLIRMPGLHIRVKEKDSCISCGKCAKACPMGLNVVNWIGDGRVKSMECIQCGACIDSCPRNVLSYGMAAEGEKGNGGRKKA